MKALAGAAMAATLTCALLAPVPADAQAAAREDRAKETMRFKPELSREQTAALPALRNRRQPCKPYPDIIAFSVWGVWHGSTGPDSLIPYPNIITNEGGRWLPGGLFINMFMACPGLYYFTVTFTRDAYVGPGLCAYGPGTDNDIGVYLTKNFVAVPGGAWAGEGDGKRATATWGVTLRLDHNDIITPWVHSDGGPPRCLADYSFTGFRIGK
jgi:hypothetical protein